MTEPYQQCSLDVGAEVMNKVVPIFQLIGKLAPEGQEGLYVSAMVSTGIAFLTKDMGEEAMKLFLERALADLPLLAKLGDPEH